MTERTCEFSTDDSTDAPQERWTCGKPARLKLHGRWYCAEHYDEVATDDRGCLPRTSLRGNDKFEAPQRIKTAPADRS